MLGLTTVSKYKKLEKRIEELEKLNNSLIEEKNIKEEKISKLEKSKSDLINENSDLKNTMQEINNFNLELQDKLTTSSKESEELKEQVNHANDMLQRQLNEYDKALASISELEGYKKKAEAAKAKKKAPVKKKSSTSKTKKQ